MQVISDELFLLCFELEATIANIIAREDVPQEIREKLAPLCREMNTDGTCELWGFRTIVEKPIYDDDDFDDGGEMWA